MNEAKTSTIDDAARDDVATLTDQSSWRVVAAACIAMSLGLLGLFWSTAESMVHIWYNFETYTHGFIIVPISLWLIWQKRHHLAAYTPQPATSMLLLFFIGLAGWSLARLTGVQVVEQAAFVGLIVVAMASLMGWQVARFLAFPLLFLFFAVPMGEDLIPPMMDFTATFTVAAIKLTGIPVYRDGLWFSLPSGNWSVVEACSGVRYLIASATLGVMYAYITYHTLWKRLLFIALSIVVPIIANGIRAYVIVMIGHLSSMKYATGVDHLIYGWVFFGIVMFILFWIGSFWQEEQAPPEKVPPHRNLTAGLVSAKAAVIVITGLLTASLAVALTNKAKNVEVELIDSFDTPALVGDWRQTTESPAWSMQHQSNARVLQTTYARDGDSVNLFVALFPRQTQGAEAINNDNQVATETALVRKVQLGRPTISLGTETLRANQSRAIVRVDQGQQEHLVYQWYRVAGQSVGNRYAGKAWEALARLYPGRADGAWIAITTPSSDLETAESEQRLRDFAKAIGPVIATEIDRFVGQD